MKKEYIIALSIGLIVLAYIVFKALAIFLSIPTILAALDLKRTAKGVTLPDFRNLVPPRYARNS